MADRHTSEREVKLAAPAGFVLPDLTGVAEGVCPFPLDVQLLDAVYLDTADLRLSRAGASLRFRSGDGTGWTVKLPEGDDGPALVRREVPFPGSAEAPPPDAIDLVRAYARGAPLLPVARLETRREGVALRDGEGQILAEVVADDVTVRDGSGNGAVSRFFEVEVEVYGRAPYGLLDDVVDRLRVAGAGAPDPTPKVVRALGPRALAPSDLAVPSLGKDPTTAEVIRAAIAASVHRILTHDAGVRLGDDPEDVHQARVGTRRLRSDLRTFGGLLDQAWAEGLRDELKWLADLLGGVRDADVLTERLRSQAAELPEMDAAGFAPVFRRLSDEREAARARLLEAMASDRYLALLDRLVAAAAQPQLAPDADGDGPAAASLVPLVTKPWRRLRKAVKALPGHPTDDALHDVRIRAKRARYAAEAVAPAAGKAARKFASAVAGVQGVLGDQHDAVVAESWLRDHLESDDPNQALAVGELVGAQRAEAAACRKAWRKAWKKANRKKLRAWMA